MFNITDQSTWVETIEDLETTDPLLGGVDGHLTQASQALANRTLYLKNQIETLAEQLAQGVNASTLNNKSQAEIEAEIIAGISGGASSAYDTLIEIQNELQSNDTDIGALMTALTLKADKTELIDIKPIYSDSNPAQNTNPSTKDMLWVNTTSGEVFICTDNTTNLNVWVGQLGSNIYGVDETVNRVLDTVYTNITGRPITVLVTLVNPSSSDCSGVFYVDDVAVAYLNINGIASNSPASLPSVVVNDGSTFKVSSGYSLFKWIEYK